MIPASYLFKDIYNQHWIDADANPTPVQQHRSSNGLTTPIRRLLAAMLRRPEKPGRRYFGVHAYD